MSGEKLGASAKFEFLIKYLERTIWRIQSLLPEDNIYQLLSSENDQMAFIILWGKRTDETFAMNQEKMD